MWCANVTKDNRNNLINITDEIEAFFFAQDDLCYGFIDLGGLALARVLVRPSV